MFSLSISNCSKAAPTSFSVFHYSVIMFCGKCMNVFMTGAV